MYYFEVLVADSSFKGSRALTYSYFQPLARGTVVEVPLKQKHVLGVITARVAKPQSVRFAVKPLSAPDNIAPLPEQLLQLALWITDFYPAGVGVTLQQFLPSKLYGLEALGSPTETQMDSMSQPSGQAVLPPLTPEQQQAVQKMSADSGSGLQAGSYLLHGETGSGKTRLYIELASRAFEQKKSSIVLTPEIGLTPQLTRNFVQAFGAANVLTTHSKLTAKERNVLWLRMLQASRPGPNGQLGQPLVVLGPRSALFSPLHNIGVIVLDESHEGSYKQEQAPHYHASKVAAQLASLHRAVLVLGSATPSITDYYLAEARNKPIIRMRGKALLTRPETADSRASDEVDIQLIDIKDRSLFTRQPHISNQLLDHISAGLKRGEQSLVFLNRRGTARIILCENCGWQSLCPHCDLPLTYHGDVHNVRCHTCGHHAPAPNSCPDCGSANIILKSIGTKAIVGELERAFPSARIQRFDTDNSKEERLEAHYEAVRAGEVDIIVGTQLIAKGLDLPKLTTVGVVVADTSLYLPDYTASERSYQLLRQVIGRVGRGHGATGNSDGSHAGTNGEPARVVIQTYDPASPVIQSAANGDWESYYAAEIAERRAFLFPPFVHTMKIWCRRASSAAAQAASEKVVASLRDSGLRLIIDGPAPAFYEKMAGKFQWQAVIKSKDRGQLVAAIRLLPANWSYDIDPANLL